ncbi:hypothetical protein KP509_03G103000 [Ceratopteris richardii]|uniref:DUF4408 domain-containing protein n=1 Tax=Ceratopteris richardii TaxID=49495 RepID=A0A8T2V6R8_CERRI|nr:hypothetical protein KP509_03G103000 [Ceratopteris richardii]
MAAAELKQYVLPASVTCSVLAACIALWYSCPEFLVTCIAAMQDSFACFRSWFTPAMLFLLMNGVVLALALTSGILNHGGEWREGELEDLTMRERNKKHNAESGDQDEVDERDGEEDYNFYPEVLSSFFADGVTSTRRKPVLRRSVSEPLAERKGKSLKPSIRGSLSQKISLSPSFLAGSNPSKIIPPPQPLSKLIHPIETTSKTAAFGVNKPLSVNAEDKDVDQRADAFIDGFYKKLKLQQVDAYMERLERSH